jgi:hypothetical protein
VIEYEDGRLVERNVFEPGNLDASEVDSQCEPDKADKECSDHRDVGFPIWDFQLPISDWRLVIVVWQSQIGNWQLEIGNLPYFQSGFRC